MWLEQKLYQALGAALVAARENAAVTQQDLARRLGKPQSFISNYENGQRRVDILEFICITEELGVEFEETAVDTIGGLIFNHLGHLPKQGQEIEIPPVRATVRKVSRKRVEEVQLTALEKEGQ